MHIAMQKLSKRRFVKSIGGLSIAGGLLGAASRPTSATRKQLTVTTGDTEAGDYEVIVDTEDVNVVEWDSKDSMSNSNGKTTISGRVIEKSDTFSIPTGAQIIEVSQTGGSGHIVAKVDASVSTVSSSVEGNVEVTADGPSTKSTDYGIYMTGYIAGYSDIESDDDTYDNGNYAGGTIWGGGIDQWRTEGEMKEVRLMAQATDLYPTVKKVQ